MRSIVVHNIPLLHGQVKVGVDEVKDAEAPVPVPTDEVILVGQTLNTFPCLADTSCEACIRIGILNLIMCFFFSIELFPVIKLC